MTVEQRRLIAWLVMMYQIQYGLTDVSSELHNSLTTSEAILWCFNKYKQEWSRTKPASSRQQRQSPPCLSHHRTYRYPGCVQGQGARSSTGI